MPAINTYRTLNDYRLSGTEESVYENGSHSKLGAGAVVAAIFLGLGAYFFYPMYQRGPHTTPATDTQYQAPAATETAAPDNTMDSTALNSAVTPDVPNATAPSPAIAPTDTATPAPAQESKMNRTATETKSNVVPAQPAPRIKPSTKAPPTATREAVPASTGDTTATPDMIKPDPIISPQPATTDHATDSVSDPTATHSEAPVEAPTTAAPDAATP